MTYALIHGNALTIPLADNSVDLVATSPPYFALRSYQDGGEHYAGQLGSEPTPADFLAALWAVTDECWRVLKPTGSLWLNLGDKYAGSGGPGGDYNAGGLRDGQPRLGASEYWRRMADCGIRPKGLMGLPWRYVLGLTCPDPYRYDGVADPPQWTLRAEVIWNKPNGLPESVTDRVRRSHENWFHLTKQGRYFAAVDEIREAHADHRAGANGGARDLHTEQLSRKWNPSSNDYNPLGKLPGSVWTIPSEPLIVPDHIGVDHFAAFPQEIVRRIILGWTPSGICTKCREPRRPVVEKTRVRDTGLDAIRGTNDGTLTPISGGADFASRAETEATITGYRCACDVNLAPTRPAVVLDPFVGTGTVVMVARALGRFGVGIDLSADYLRLARWRVTSGHANKSINKTNRERQGSLW
jgi:DNA modification methylase